MRSVRETSAVRYNVTCALGRCVLLLAVEIFCDGCKEILDNVNNIKERPGIL